MRKLLILTCLLCVLCVSVASFMIAPTSPVNAQDPVVTVTVIEPPSVPIIQPTAGPGGTIPSTDVQGNPVNTDNGGSLLDSNNAGVNWWCNTWRGGSSVDVYVNRKLAIHQELANFVNPAKPKPNKFGVFLWLVTGADGQVYVQLNIAVPGKPDLEKHEFLCAVPSLQK